MQLLRPIVTCFFGIMYIAIIIYGSSPSHPVLDAKLKFKLTANQLNELIIVNNELMLWTVNKQERRLELWAAEKIIYSYNIDGEVCCMLQNDLQLKLIHYKIEEEDMLHEQLIFTIRDNQGPEVLVEKALFPGSLKISRCVTLRNDSILYTRNQDKRLFRVRNNDSLPGPLISSYF